MNLYSYIVKHDTGFAPNPFHGYCTLACCKPKIRQKAVKGDWIVGLTPKAAGNRIVYLMRVDEVIESFAEYWRDRRFAPKKPSYGNGPRKKCGDNIYEPLASGSYRQLRSAHSNGEAEHESNKAHDLSGKRVLVSETFAYFRSKALSLPPELQSLVVRRGHRSRFSEEVKSGFIHFAGKVGLGMHGPPTGWPDEDSSWIKGRGCVPRNKK
jgi:putative DNA base modification enzyme with NMAD domain